MTKILVTGGSGLLGQELVKHFDLVFAPNHQDFDITKKLPKLQFDLIIHAAAYTNTKRAEKEGKKDCQKVNIDGTLNLLRTYPNVPFVFISSEYAMKPINFYSATKTVGELLTQVFAKPGLIIRTAFKPRPWPWGMAFGDQFTRADYVDVIAKLIAEEIKKWNRKTSKTVHVGTKRKTMYQLAKQTRPDVEMNNIKDVKGVCIQADYK